ncbi:hypothetical protein PR048_002194 [Dryococelus australis]|uniref:Uncharacterized protein n=1 Tax=Dryococelus australis TaxID=614101 RepID=A0ABQ9IJH8_9NEOP|nr:hypothetical protein PR048_002194 [Dryococelus australis]
MAMNNLTHRQTKLQLSPASHPKERYDTAFGHAIPQASQYGQFFPQGILQSSKPTDPAPSTAASNVGFPSTKTFSAVINYLCKPLLSEATSGPSQNKLRPIRNTPSVNGALLRCDNGRLDNSHSPSASGDSLSGADSLTGHLQEAALEVAWFAALEDDASPLAQAIYALRQILHDQAPVATACQSLPPAQNEYFAVELTLSYSAAGTVATLCDDMLH